MRTAAYSDLRRDNRVAEATQTAVYQTAIAVVDYDLAIKSLPQYAHRYSPRKFTQPQRFACLVLQQFMKLDDRNLQAFLVDAPDLAAAVGLQKIPHFTTFQKAASR